MDKVFDWFVGWCKKDYILYQRLKVSIIINVIFLVLSPILLIQYFVSSLYNIIPFLIIFQILIIFSLFLLRKQKFKLSIFFTIFSWQIFLPLSLIFFDKYQNVFESYRISFLLFVATILAIIILSNRKYIYIITTNNILIIFLSFVLSKEMMSDTLAVSSHITCLVGFNGIAILGDYFSGFINFIISENREKDKNICEMKKYLDGFTKK